MAAAGGESRIDGGFCEGYVTKDEKAGYKGKSKMNIQQIRKTMEAVFVTGQIRSRGFYFYGKLHRHIFPAKCSRMMFFNVHCSYGYRYKKSVKNFMESWKCFLLGIKYAPS